MCRIPSNPLLVKTSAEHKTKGQLVVHGDYFSVASCRSDFPAILLGFAVWSVGAGIAQSVLRLATAWIVRGWNPDGGGGQILRTRPDRPWGPPSPLYNGYRVFLGGKATGARR